MATHRLPSDTSHEIHFTIERVALNLGTRTAAQSGEYSPALSDVLPVACKQSASG